MIHNYFWEICCILAVLLFGSNLWLYLRVLYPIQQLAKEAKKLGEGDFAAIHEDGGGIAEIQSLRRSMGTMVAHVRRAQAQSVKYADNLSEGQESERLRIARELHDDTIQSLIAISQSIDMAKTWFNSMPEQATKMLDLARQQAVSSVSDLRRLIENLRPPALEELGLIPALKMLFERCDFPIEFKLEGQERRLEPNQELVFFRCAQEALSNARRHSDAKKVVLCLNYHPEHLSMSIKDDGKGFSLPFHFSDLADDGHYGLMGIHERVKQVKGDFELYSQANKGTEISIKIPFGVDENSDELVQDPVCHAEIHPQHAYASSQYQEKTYYFCCPVCQGAFQQAPEHYLGACETVVVAR